MNAMAESIFTFRNIFHTGMEVSSNSKEKLSFVFRNLLNCGIFASLRFFYFYVYLYFLFYFILFFLPPELFNNKIYHIISPIQHSEFY